MKICSCGTKIRKKEIKCYSCSIDEYDFEYKIKIDQKRWWRSIEEWNRVKRETSKLEKIAYEKRREEDRMEAEAERRRVEEQKNRMIAEAERQYKNAIQMMSNDSKYDAEDELKLKSQRSSKGFQRRRRKIRFPADEINIREKYLAKIKVRE